MSWRPNALAPFVPTACVVSSELAESHATSSSAAGSAPLDHGVVVPARQACSHSDSEGIRWNRPVRPLSHFVYCLAANWVMVTAGSSGSSPFVNVVVGS